MKKIKVLLVKTPRQRQSGSLSSRQAYAVFSDHCLDAIAHELQVMLKLGHPDACVESVQVQGSAHQNIFFDRGGHEPGFLAEEGYAAVSGQARRKVRLVSRVLF